MHSGTLLKSSVAELWEPGIPIPPLQCVHLSSMFCSPESGCLRKGQHGSFKPKKPLADSPSVNSSVKTLPPTESILKASWFRTGCKWFTGHSFFFSLSSAATVRKPFTSDCLWSLLLRKSSLKMHMKTKQTRQLSRHTTECPRHWRWKDGLKFVSIAQRNKTPNNCCLALSKWGISFLKLKYFQFSTGNWKFYTYTCSAESFIWRWGFKSDSSAS